MPRTIRRQPVSVSTDSDNYSKTYSLTQIDFKGIYDKKNDVTVDASSFVDAKNVYIDEGGTLVSRPPFRLDDAVDTYIIDQWQFDEYTLRAYRFICTENGDRIDKLTDYSQDELYFVYTFKCISHQINGPEMMWQIPVTAIGWDYVPKITCALIEDKIFIWFAGIDFVALNLVTKVFEDATQYLYLPIHKLVINGIESDLETKNFLTETYKRRFQYSMISTVNFGELRGKRLEVNYAGDATQNISDYLYDLTIDNYQEKTLIYPHSTIGDKYIDIVQTPRATVMMRYDVLTQTIEISFDKLYFRALPLLTDIVGLPMLTKDGLYVVAFTRSGLAKCKLVAQESVDDDDIFVWTRAKYFSKGVADGKDMGTYYINTDFLPVGYFETIDNFVYIIKSASVFDDVTNDIPYLYTEYPAGTYSTRSLWEPLISTMDNDELFAYFESVQKIVFKYVAPVAGRENPHLFVSILGTQVTLDGSVYEPYAALILHYDNMNDTSVHPLSNDDNFSISKDGETELTGYFHSMDAEYKFLTDKGQLRPGDRVLYTAVPFPATQADRWSSRRAYRENEYVKYYIDGEVLSFRCKKDCLNEPPSLSENAYWQVIIYDGKPLQANNWYSLSYSTYTGTFPRRYLREYIIRCNTQAAILLARDDVRLTRRMLLQENPADEYLSGSAIDITFPAYDVKYSAEDLKNIGATCELVQVTETDSLNTTTDVTDVVLEGLGVNRLEFDWSHLIDFVGTVDNGVRKLGLSYSGVSGYTMYSGVIIIEGNDNDEYAKKFERSLAKMAPGTDADVSIITPTLERDIVCDVLLAYGQEEYDVFEKLTYDTVKAEITIDASYVDITSSHFKIMPDNESVLTDEYLWINKQACSLPNTGKLSPIVDTERFVQNNDILLLSLIEDDTLQQYKGNIHLLSATNFKPISGRIRSGDLVAYTKHVSTEFEYAQDYFYIERLGIKDGEWEVLDGEIKPGDLIRLRSYDRVYPSYAGPAEFWPFGEISYPPIYPTADGGIRRWTRDDPLPEGGHVEYYGVVSIHKRVLPLYIGTDGIYCNINGTLWTSVLDNGFFELDEYINAANEGSNIVPITNIVPPDFCKMLNEYYFAYNDTDGAKLQITLQKRDENKLLSGQSTDLLLYLPLRNEQKFASQITNLHPLSDTEMGIFTTNTLWYISTLVGNDGSVVYTKPILSKTPTGCRYGNDIITGFDGQSLIFATPRGITALAPQDFVATTEKALTYLSDAIQEKYTHFYNDDVVSINVDTDGLVKSSVPNIKIVAHKYWLLFYRQMDREIFALDSRNGSWWIWTTPYPIRKLFGGNHLEALLQIDFTPVEVVSDVTIIRAPFVKSPLLGVPFILRTDDDYHDSVIDGALNGTLELIYENEFIGDRRKFNYASPIIDWHITSQKLHFNQIENYKTVKGLNFVFEGTDNFVARLSTKAFRSLHHPGQTSVMDVKINEIRSFVKRTNLMHILNFQYTLENEPTAELPAALRLNALSIKYEVKEKIR